MIESAGVFIMAAHMLHTYSHNIENDFLTTVSFDYCDHFGALCCYQR
jgi:hypothetical protein